MDLKAIKQVVDLMKRSDLSEFEIEEEGFKLRIRRSGGDAPVNYNIQAAPTGMATPPPFPAAGTTPAASPANEEEPKDEAGISVVKSPMVGTFYRAPSPESPVFVETGSKVDASTTVCIIEAMKVMNEIQAELKGTITEVLVENGEAVEFGQPLFKVKTA